MDAAAPLDEVVRTGIEGLDDVLGGGLTPHRLYAIEGAPGSGKTTLALQFLMEGARLGESVLYVTLSESAAELEGVARSHGWDMTGVTVRETLPSPDSLQSDEQYTMFHPSEVELGETTQRILDDVERLSPRRVVFDSLSELQLLAGGSLRYRRQILALKQFLGGRQCTVLLLDDMSKTSSDQQVQSIAHAVIRMEQTHSDYGAVRRRLVVVKYRGREFRAGFHDYKIARGGLQVFPRLVAAEHVVPVDHERLPCGLDGLDRMIGGGLERGTSTLFVGPPGTGKSTIAIQFAIAAARRDEHSAIFIFDESIATLRTRCQGMSMDLERYVESGHIQLRQIDPGEMSPGELVHDIRQAVSKGNARIVAIDSLNGYLNAMPDDHFLIVQLHELLTFLGQSGVATLLVGAQSGMLGSNLRAPVDASYLSDAIVMLRYFESDGEIRQAISVMKKRGGFHERNIREFSMTPSGLHVGEPLRGFRGILTGIPVPVETESAGAR